MTPICQKDLERLNVVGLFITYTILTEVRLTGLVSSNKRRPTNKNSQLNSYVLLPPTEQAYLKYMRNPWCIIIANEYNRKTNCFAVISASKSVGLLIKDENQFIPCENATCDYPRSNTMPTTPMQANAFLPYTLSYRNGFLGTGNFEQT